MHTEALMGSGLREHAGPARIRALLKACISTESGPLPTSPFSGNPSRIFLTLRAQDKEGMTQATGHS